MTYVVRLKPSAAKEYAKLPGDVYGRIQAALVIIAVDPFNGKKLRGQYRDHYSYRIWPYRIIYQIHKNELLVIIVRIGHRQGVY